MTEHRARSRDLPFGVPRARPSIRHHQVVPRVKNCLPGRTFMARARRAAPAFAATLLAGCSLLPWSDHGPTLYAPVNGSVGEGQTGLTPGVHFSFGDLPVCLDEAGTATITRVELVNPVNGLTVLAFAVRTIPAGTTPWGAHPGDLTDLGLTPAEQATTTVTNVCGQVARRNAGLDGPPPAGTSDQRVELDLTLSAPHLPARADAVRIWYRVDGQDRSTLSPVAFALCAGKIGDSCF